MNVSSNEQDADRDRVKSHVDQLSEHFDSVHIFVTRHVSGEDNGTVYCNRDNGNFLARMCQVREWLIYEEERIRIAARKSEEE